MIGGRASDCRNSAQSAIPMVAGMAALSTPPLDRRRHGEFGPDLLVFCARPDSGPILGVEDRERLRAHDRPVGFCSAFLVGST
jgi:hypothetical protein